MDQKQLSQLDPKLKAVYDRVMGIANTAPPPPPQMTTPVQTMPSSVGPIQTAPILQSTPSLNNPTPVIQAAPTPFTQTPSVSDRPSFVVEEVPAAPAALNQTIAPVNSIPPMLQTPLATPPTPPVLQSPMAQPTPPHADQGQVFFSQGTNTIPTLRQPVPPPSMQPVQATMPVGVAPQGQVVTPHTGHGFMILFIILGVIFFILYGIFWVQLFNIGIPALTSS